MSMLSRATGTTKERSPRDFYRTVDPRAVVPLVAHLGRDVCYAEPCAGGGDLIDLFHPHGWQCQWASDLHPMRRSVYSTGQLIAQEDALQLAQLLDDHPDLLPDMFVTNPPWNRPVMHEMIAALAEIRPVWMLFDAAWPQTKQAIRLGPICHTIISVGRLKWFSGTKNDATTDCSWYGFDARARSNQRTEYIWPISRLRHTRDGEPAI